MDSIQMKLSRVILLIVIVLVLKSNQGGCNVYTVSSQSHQCSEGIRNCHDLLFYIQDVSQYFVSNTEFKFLSGTHTLSNTPVPVTISGINNITFTGQSTIDTPIIQCTNGSHGFVFWNTVNITLRSLIIEGCSPTIHDSPLTVTNCNSLTLRDFTIRNTTGVGLMIHNVSIVHITCSNFSNNGPGISNCSLVAYQWRYSVNIIATDVGEVNYTITDTVFNGNIANNGQLGGGLHCYINNARSAVVILKNSMFRGINGCSAAADITVNNSILANVTVNDSTFIGNYNAEVATLKKLVPSGGGLNIEIAQQQWIHLYDNAEHTYSSTVVIGNSTFTYNRAWNYAGAAVITWASNNNVHVINSTFKHNGKSWSNVGGIYISPTGFEMLPSAVGNITVDVVDSKFVSNSGCFGAAALQISPYIYDSDNCIISIRNSIFQLNEVPPDCIFPYSIGITAWNYDLYTRVGSMSVIIDNCHVINEKSGGMIVSLNSGAIINEKYSFNVCVKMTSCVFRANHMGFEIETTAGNHYDIIIQSSNFFEHFPSYNQSLKGGVVIVKGDQLAIVNIVNVSIYNNSGMSAISVKNCILKFSGYNVIENNTTPGGGGGIQFTNAGFAYMSLTNTTVIFRNNRATYGGALYGRVLYNSLSEDKAFTFNIWKQCTFLNLITAVFENNSASIAGNNMYGGLARNCYYNIKWRQKYIKLLSNCSYLSPPNGLFQFGLSSVSSDPFRVLLCNKEHKVLADENSVTVSLYPGQYVYVTVTAVGYCNGFSPGFLNVSTSTIGVKIMENNVQGQRIDHPCGNVSFKPLLPQSNTTVTVEIDVAQSVFPQTFPLKVIVNVSSCPHGMFLERSTKGCQCDSIIRNYVHQCNVSHIPNPFMKSINSNNWMTYNNKKHCIDIIPICPFDYCSLRTNIYFNLDNTTDYQCNNNRTGTLCGQCQPGLSLMFGSNRCKQCFNNKYLLLLIVFFIAGILLIFLIMFLNLTVSVGMLNGLLFYANIVKLNETQLFPNGSIPVISQFISWLNLDFGIELCFYNGLDGYWKTWLQFVFPLYLWLVTIGIIQYSKYSIKFSRYLPNNIISVLATLILISFTKLLRTVTAVFMATRLHCGTHTELLWSVDGSIEYWSIKHSLLMGFASIALIFIAVYTFLLLFSQCLQRASNYRICCCLQHIFLRILPFIDAYTGPFVPSYGYWTGVLVLFRIIVTVVFTYTSGSVDYINNYVIVLIEVVIFNVFHSGFYQSKLNYYCEKFFHINLCVLCVINALDHFHDIPYVAIIATMTSVTLSLLVFIAIVCLHIYRILHKRCIEKRLNEVQPLLQQVEGNDENGRYSPSATVRRRDSIIFDFSIN